MLLMIMVVMMDYFDGGYFLVIVFVSFSLCIRFTIDHCKHDIDSISIFSLRLKSAFIVCRYFLLYVHVSLEVFVAVEN